MTVTVILIVLIQIALLSHRVLLLLSVTMMESVRLERIAVPVQATVQEKRTENLREDIAAEMVQSKLRKVLLYAMVTSEFEEGHWGLNLESPNFFNRPGNRAGTR
jgi:hypothetical protein